MIPLLMLTLGTTQEPYPTITDTWVYHQWINPGEEYVQALEFAKDNDFSNPPARSWTNQVNLRDGFVGQPYFIQEDGFICRRVKYHTLNKNDYKYLNLGCFYQTGNNISQPIPDKKKDENKQNYILPKDVDFREQTSNPKKDMKEHEVLGVTTKKEIPKCVVQLREDTLEVISFDCDIGFKVNNIAHTKMENLYEVVVEGIYKEKVNADIQLYTCEKFNILNPNTWFKCVHIFQRSFEKEISLLYTVQLHPKYSKYNSGFKFDPDSFSTRNILDRDISGMNPFLLVKIYSQFKDTKWFDIEHIQMINIDIPKPINNVQFTRPFTFPLDRLIGVTQWHGCTAYQCPHKGIDFGARLNKVVAVGDGKVIKTGWDSYGGTCNQGGNYVTIFYSNGMYSLFFHLDHYLVKIGDTVKKGQVIGVSGNTGKWNCQNLGYHLHFEVRKGSSSSTHLDPVKYIDVNWNLIPSIGKDQYPKRLTGDNPHPNF